MERGWRESCRVTTLHLLGWHFVPRLVSTDPSASKRRQGEGNDEILEEDRAGNTFDQFRADPLGTFFGLSAANRI